MSELCARTALTLMMAVATSQVHAQSLPPIESAEFEARSGFRVNGKPFFPILLYDIKSDDATLAEYRDFGFNVLACDAKLCDSLPAKGFYGAIHANKKIDSLTGVFMAIGMDSPALNYKKNLLQQTADGNKKVQDFVPKRPLMNAIGYWEDEPAGVYAGKLPSKEKYDDLVRAIDVSAPYLYPLPYQPVASVGEAVARARIATEGKKPLLPILQLFAWKAEDRYPTPAELRAMTFLALVEGGHGVGYYSYGYVTGKKMTTLAKEQPVLWKSVKSLNQDVAKIGPRLVAGAPSDVFALDHPGVRMKTVSDGDSLLGVIVNGTPQKQDIQLKWKSGDSEGRLMVEDGEAIEVKRGTARMTLEPYAVRIVRWK